MSILYALRAALPDLPKKLAQAARYALDHPDQMALNSMRSTATEVGVTSTTMLRLARYLGYESYDDFRASFQNELVRGVFGSRADALRQDQTSLDVSAEDGSGSLSNRIIAAAETNIGQLRSTLRQEELETIAGLMRKAPNVFLIGSSSMHILASMIKITGNMILPNLRLVGAEYYVAAETMGNLTADDVVIGIGLNPQAKRTIEAMKYARSRGAHLVAITDRPSSPIAEGAEFVLCGDNASPHYYPSLTPIMVIIEALLATVVATGDGEELRRIQDIEAIRKGNDGYLEY